MTVTVIGFDADDTLWHSENFFVEMEARFHEVMRPWADSEETAAKLLKCEEENLKVFGYGVKGFVLSMIEVALEMSGGKIGHDDLSQLLAWAKELHSHPVELMEGVRETVAQVGADYRLLLITKGDLLHQSMKIEASGLAEHFEACKILTHKSPEQYQDFLKEKRIDPAEFLMVGNSLRSDILPILTIGSRAVHIPHDKTWGHEEIDSEEHSYEIQTLEKFSGLPEYLSNLANKQNG